jgi:hypothetical protein
MARELEQKDGGLFRRSGAQTGGWWIVSKKRSSNRRMVDCFEEAELKQEDGGLFRRSGALAPKSSLNTHTLRHAYLTSVQSNLVDG